MLDPYMKELAREFEVPGFKSDIPGVYVIPLEEDVKISVSAQLQGYYISCAFTNVPTGKEEAFYNQALLANLFGQGTKGADLGLTEDGKKLMLSLEIPHEVSYVDFRNALEDFINMIDFWREEVLNYR